MRFREECEHRVSPRVVLRHGDRFRLRGGPVFVDAEGQPHVLRMPGTFRFLRAYRKGQRVWIECIGERTGQWSTLFVSGRAYRRHGLIHKPFKVNRVR